MIETEIFSRLRKAIEKLPRECRKVFELCYFEGMNNEKAAQTLRISIETVKAQYASDTEYARLQKTNSPARNRCLTGSTGYTG